MNSYGEYWETSNIIHWKLKILDLLTQCDPHFLIALRLDYL